MSKKKKIILIFSIAVFILFIALCIGYFVYQNSKSDAIKFKNEYEKLNNVAADKDNNYIVVNISEDNKVKYTTLDNIINSFENKLDCVLFIGDAKCSYCRFIAEILTDIANETSLDEILYIKNNIKDLDKLSNYFDGLTIDISDFDKGVVLFIVDGKVVSYNIGTIFSHTNPYQELDKYQKEGLEYIYRNGIDYVIKSKNIKNQVKNVE